jgi:hypothetical protein
MPFCNFLLKNSLILKDIHHHYLFTKTLYDEKIVPDAGTGLLCGHKFFFLQIQG